MKKEMMLEINGMWETRDDAHYCRRAKVMRLEVKDANPRYFVKKTEHRRGHNYNDVTHEQLLHSKEEEHQSTSNAFLSACWWVYKGE